MKKFAIIGAGSTYTPELIEGLNKFKDKMQFDEITLYDTAKDRLDIMFDFIVRYSEKLGYKTKFIKASNLKEAVENAMFVNTQIRVAGNAYRVLDEKIPLKYGLIGQETTGAGGFMKAQRTIPEMLEIARAVEEYAKDAWIVNYTNPTGLVTEAIVKSTNVNIVGFCSGGIFPKMWAKESLGLEYDRVQYDFVGLNHMNYAYNIAIDGRPATHEEFVEIGKANHEIDIELIKLLNAIPSPYLQYYYHTSKKLDEFKNAKQTRGERVMDLEVEIYAELKDVNNCDKPKTLAKRGGGGYSDVAIGFMNAIYNNIDTEMVVNVPNNGAIPFLKDESIVEVNCLVNKRGVFPLAKSPEEIPEGVSGLIAEVKNYEELAVKAALTGDIDIAKKALIAHPLIREYKLVDKMLPELLEANKDYLPQYKLD